MISLIITVVSVIIISALCSTLEAALYSIPWTYIEHLKSQGSKKGKLLYHLRKNIDQSITAILTLNTVANTAGATLAGAIAAKTLPPSNMPLFTALLTIFILAFGEIIPKTLGVVYAKQVSSFFSRPLGFLIFILKPLIMLATYLTRLISPPTTPTATEDDIRAITRLSRESGKIEAYEEHVIKNILSLDLKYAREIMTPRTMVFSLHEDTTVAQAYAEPKIWSHSRIPVYSEDNEDVIGIVQRHEIAKLMAQGAKDKKLSGIMKPVRFVLESQTADRLLLEFLEKRQHLFIVLDEYGGLAGVVSLEDVLEAMLGREIVDESDQIPDLREIARKRRLSLIQNKTPSIKT